LKIVYDVEDTDISVYDILKKRNILENHSINEYFENVGDIQIQTIIIFTSMKDTYF
jgi:hypothetical protein